ncbi:MAG TPA: LLM class flavin-dependent oxidoreductase [Solirubrobacteraceae bacterium]|jgi:alkanesulfonate monooxygenase SsuD/methylene tetrahydromethanopterin reductase-like flavin-dependent oxidoreductase (luciferase family)
MRFGVFLPNFGPFGEVDALVQLATAAEASGWDGFFIWDHIALGEADERPIADPWVALTAVAAMTKSLRIGTAITPLARRRPWKLARETATLDRFARGRLTLGVGLGYPPDAEFGRFGEETDDRVRADKLDEGLEVLRGLWSGERFDFEGEHYRISDARFDTPYEASTVPVWCGGWWPNRRPFRRAARWDGVIPEMVGGATPSPDHVREIRDYIARHRSQMHDFDVVINGYTDGAGDTRTGDYEQAGVTWWLERFDTSRLYSFEEALERIEAGVPGGGSQAGDKS